MAGRLAKVCLEIKMQYTHFACQSTSQDQDLARGGKSDTPAYRYFHFSAEQGAGESYSQQQGE
jgi:hypothetical protein